MDIQYRDRVAQPDVTAMLGDNSNTTTANESSSLQSLSFRHYRFASSPQLRQALLKFSSDIPTRVLQEILEVLPARQAASTPASNETCADALKRENKLLQCDTDISTWCERLTATLEEADFMLHDEMIASWITLLYPVVTDTSFLFRSVDLWTNTVMCFNDVAGRRQNRLFPPSSTCSIPWDALYNLLQEVFHVPCRHRALPSLKCVQDKVSGVVHRLCRAASDYFDRDALEGLWEKLAPSFRPEGFPAIQALGYFTTLAPRFQIGSTSCHRSITSMMVDLALIQSATWHPTSLSWMYFAWTFLEKVTPISLLAQGLEPLPMEKYAEPCFSSILYALRLPVGDSDVRRGLSVGGKSTLEMLIPQFSSFSLQRVHAVVCEMLTNDITSPLWSQLRRFMHGIDVFVRPTAKPHQGLQQLVRLLVQLSTRMGHRLKLQRKIQKLHPVNSEAARIYFLTQESVNEFSKILLPSLLSALYNQSRSVSGDAHIAIQALSRIAPDVCFPAIVELCDLGFSADAEVHQCTIALELLGNCVPELLLGSSTDQSNDRLRSSLSAFLEVASGELIALMDPGDRSRTMFTARIMFQRAVYFHSSDDAEKEQTLLLMFVDKMITFSRNCETIGKGVSEAFLLSLSALFAVVGDDTMELVAERVCRQCSEIGEYGTVYPLRGLLRAVASRHPGGCWKRLLRVVQDRLLDPLASTSEVHWYSNILIGLLHCGCHQIVFSHRGAVLVIVDALMIRVTCRNRVLYSTSIYRALIGALTRRYIQCKSEPQFETASTAKLNICQPLAEHLHFCGAECSKRIEACLLNLTCVDQAVAAQHKALSSLYKKSGTVQHNNDDDPLTIASVRRATLRILRSLVECSVLFFALDTTTTASIALTSQMKHGTLAPHVLSARTVLSSVQSDVYAFPQDAMMTVTVDRVLDVLFQTFPEMVGSDNYVAERVPPSASRLTRPVMLNNQGDCDVQGIKLIIKILSTLCNAEPVMDEYIDPLQAFFNNWRAQAKLTSGVRSMPSHYWALAGNIQEHASSRNVIIPIQVATLIEIGEVLQQIATHHRFTEAQEPARVLLLNILQIVGPTVDTHKIVEGCVADLESQCKIACKLLSCNAIEETHNTLRDEIDEDESSASRHHYTESHHSLAGHRFDHELHGTMHLLLHVVPSFIVPYIPLCIRVADVLTSFPDVLHNREEQLKRSLLYKIESERMLHSNSCAASMQHVDDCIARSAHHASSSPSKAGKWLELAASLWPRTFRMEASETRRLDHQSITTLIRLSVNDQLRLRSLAQHLFGLLLSTMKVRSLCTTITLDHTLPGLSSFSASQAVRQSNLAQHIAQQTSDGHPWFGLRSLGQWYTPKSFSMKLQRKLSVSEPSTQQLIISRCGLTTTDDAGLRDSWIWQALQQHVDEATQYSKRRAQFWKILMIAGGTSQVVDRFCCIFAALTQTWPSVGDGSERAKESHAGMISVLAEIVNAAIRSTARDTSSIRDAALRMLTDFIRIVVSPTVSHESLAIAQRGIVDLRNALTAPELTCIMQTQLEMLKSNMTGGTSQTCIRLLTLLLQQLNTFSYDVVSAVVPSVVSFVSQNLEMFLSNVLSQVRNHCASVLRQIMQCSWFTSCTDEVLLGTLTRFSLSIIDEAQNDFIKCKSTVVMWAYPPAAILCAVLPQLLRFFARALDERVEEQDDLFANANGTLISIAFTRVDKEAVGPALLEHADILLESHPFGHSRNAKLAICRALRIFLFTNLHRVGKFAVIERMTDASLTTMSNADKRVRNEGKVLLSIIVRVASAEQMSSIVKKIMEQLRLSEATAAPGQPSKLSLCIALCGIILADPDSVPPYVPRTIERLIKLGRDKNQEIASSAKQGLTEWWSSHRDKWFFSHRRHFSESQASSLLEIFNSPSYLA